MASVTPSSDPQRAPRRRRDLGRLVARLLCFVFALIGAIPLGGGLLLRSAPVHDWAARETARLLEEHLGLEASYSLELSLWPFRVAVTELVVPATDGAGPALTAESVAVRPRFFSLLAGRLDVGDIELDRLRARLVVRDGEVVNVRYSLPDTSADAAPLERAPFQTLALGDLRLDLDIDGTRVVAGPIDADVFAERGLTFDLALRVAGAELIAHRGDAVDEDVLCGLDLRLRYAPEQLLIRRLSLLALADLDPSPGTRGDCQRDGEAELGRVALRMSQLRVTPREEREDELPAIEGRIFARGPGPLVNRYVDMAPVEGWIGFSGDVRFDGSGRLPTITGQLSGAGLGVDGFRLARYLEADLRLTNDVIELPTLRAGFADGDVHVEGVRVAPFESGGTLEVPKLHVTGVKFPGLMRDLDVTPDTIVQWNIDDVRATDVRGTLSPFFLDGSLEAKTDHFAVFDSAWHEAARATMVRAGAARIGGRFRADSDALQFYDTRVRFGSSDLLAKLVSIGFDNSLVLDIPEGAVIDLADIGPLGGLEVSGVARLGVTMRGPAATAPLLADLAVDELTLAGFRVGDVKSSKARFEPLHVDFEDLVAVSGGSQIRLDRARLDFDGPASVSFDAHLRSDRLAIRDFLAVWNMADDPRYDGIDGAGRVEADVHYALGGPEDRCASGVLAVDGRVALDQLELFDERYASAEADFHLHWWDMDAGDHGYDLRVPSMTLRKGTGAIVGSLTVNPGAKLRGQLVASAIPLSSIDALGVYSRQWDGVVNGVARLGGTLGAFEVTANVDVSPLRQGRTQMPASHLRVHFEPVAPPAPVGRTRCGHGISPPFDLARHRRDESDGAIRVSGEIWDGQIQVDDLRITRQRSKVVSGRLSLVSLDLGAVAATVPGWADDGLGPSGNLSGQLALGHLPLDRLTEARAELTLGAMNVAAEGFRVELASPSAKVVLAEGELTSHGLAWSVETPLGQRGIFDLDARISRGQQLDATLALRETSLGTLAPLLPGVERADGTVSARLTAHGPLSAPKYAGALEIHNGRVFLERLDSPIDSLELALALDNSGFSIQQGSARIGGGTLQLSGAAPLAGTQLGRMSLGLRARDVVLPLGDGIRVTVDSDLEAVHDPGRSGSGHGALPRVTGTIDVVSAEYRRPMSVTADLAALTARGKKTNVDGYDPSRDNVELDVLVRSKNPMRVENDLVEGELRIDSSGLRISGTDQRYGAVGAVQVVPGGRVRLRRNAFEIRQGIVRFNDPTRIAPQVDLTASTEYRRYDDPGRSENQVAASGTAGSSSLGGSWRIHLHAYGEPENLRVDLTSDPALAQDDIFLLLTVGLTRAELDQTRNAGLGSSVALEALGTLSGADQAVTEVVPVIDDFRFGSAYSTRTGRTEPTVTIGKRLSDRIRANVTTSLSDSSEVRSNLEWRMSPRVSIEGAYDNVKDIGANSLGNVGGDVRWRLEFE